MRRRGIPQAHASIPNLAPMVDVVMVILIFFMLGTSFAVSEGALPTQLPARAGPGGGAKVAIIPVVRIAILVHEGGMGCKVDVLGKELVDRPFEQLYGFLDEKRRAGADPTAPVLLGAEPSVAYQNVISAMDACVRAGFRNVQFAVGTGTVAAQP